MHDEIPYVVAAYAVTWSVLIAYTAYLWRQARRVSGAAAE